MPIKFKKAKPAFTYIEQEPYFFKLLVRAQRVIKSDDRKANRAFFGYIDGMIKAGGLGTTELRITRELKRLRELVNKSIETGKVDMTLRGYFDENKLPESE